MSGSTVDGHGLSPGAVRSYLAEMGPSWVAGAIAAGPATMGSLILGGASTGYALLWVVVVSVLAGTTVQYLAMRLGLLTEAGIVSVVERHLGEWVAWVLVADVVIAAGVAQFLIMKTVATVSATITGVDARLWGIIWAVILAVGLAGEGYRFLEVLAKVLVGGVVIAFVASLFVVPVEAGTATAGLVPSLPAGSATAAAGIVGGAVHITLITMHSYTMRARGWTERDYGLASFDVIASMLVAFGIFSISIYLVAASMLSDPNLSTIGASEALGPLVGSNAKWLFLLGLGGAAVTTLGGNTIAPPFLLADKLGWGTTVEDSRYRALLAGTALVSALGAFIGGNVLGQLVLVLALGTVGTPFAIAVVLYLLNSSAVPESNSTALNLAGVGVLALSSGLAARFVREQLDAGLGVLSGLVLAFALCLATVTVLLAGRYVRREMA